MDDFLESYLSGGGKGIVIKYSVLTVGSNRVVPFVKFYRDTFNLPSSFADLKKLFVYFQVCEYDDRISLIFNRTESRSNEVCSLFKFNDVVCLKVGERLKSMFGVDSIDEFYVSRKNDGTLSLALEKDKLERGVLIQTFGVKNCVLPLRVFIDDKVDSMDYFVMFDNGVCSLRPFIYSNEIKLIVNGNSLFIPVTGFVDKLKRVVEEGEERIYVRVFDDQQVIDFLK